MEERIARLEALTDQTAEALVEFQRHTAQDFANVRTEMNDRFNLLKADADTARKERKEEFAIILQHIDKNAQQARADTAASDCEG
ncbi:hypothetical protein HSX11_16700 [Oxalobacteraceae bacterium]|nr:hypothetical protein [Oxalobacteraceae bacterium]